MLSDQTDWLALKLSAPLYMNYVKGMLSYQLNCYTPHDFYTGDIMLVADQITATGANMLSHPKLYKAVCMRVLVKLYKTIIDNKWH